MSITMKPNQSWLSLDATLQVAEDVFDVIGTPVAKAAKCMIAGARFEEAVNASISPKDYGDALSFARDYQVVSLLRKSAFLETSIDRRQAALKKFLDAEKQCELTNARIWPLLHDPLIAGSLNETENVDDLLGSLMKAQQIVYQILGPVPEELDFRFGPGSTSLVKGEITTPRKYSREIHVTPELYSYWRDIAGPTWCKTVENVQLISGSSISFVPKDAKTDRTIGIEPHLNIYAQLGIGAHMRKRFRPWIDLNVGQERNRFLAKVAQSCGLCTIDFSSASDTVSRAIVELLLPPTWCDLLDRVRSHRYLINGDEAVFHKHSSMGNGYTFELESIIFYALARASCWKGNPFFTEVVSVYGDDVILPQCFAQRFITLAEYCGFTVNREKSFLSGSFYESCGHDYFNGINVRPAFWKDLSPTFGFKAHNDIRRMAHRLLLPDLEKVATKIRKHAGRELGRCLIPDGYGDVGFIVPFDVACPSLIKAGRGYDGFTTKAVKYRTSKHDYAKDTRGLLAALDTSVEQSLSPVRGRGVYQVGRLTTFGSWVGIGADSH